MLDKIDQVHPGKPIFFQSLATKIAKQFGLKDGDDTPPGSP